jgi:integrase
MREAHPTVRTPTPEENMTGITLRHRTACPARSDKAARCSCTPSYRVRVYDARTGKKIIRQFRSEAEAKTWQLDTRHALHHGKQVSSDTTPTLADAADELVAGMKSGAIRTRSGDTYKPAVVYDYERNLANDVTPVLGGYQLNEMKPARVRELIEHVQRRNVSTSRLKNIVMPLRVLNRRAVELEHTTSDWFLGITMPADRGKRDTIATPEQARRMMDALPVKHQAAWALAFYGGLRLGELRELRWRDVDFDKGVLTVERAWCNRTRQVVDTKSTAADRTVPMAGKLRTLLLEQRMRTGGRGGADLVVTHGRVPGTPPSANALGNHAKAAWENVDGVPAGLTMHEARHTYASLMIAAGVQPKALSEFMGHSSITITLDRYGHLFPGAHAEAAQLLDRYLDSQSG